MALRCSDFKLEPLTEESRRRRQLAVLGSLLVLGVVVLVFVVALAALAYTQYIPSAKRSRLSTGEACAEMTCTYGGQCLVDPATGRGYCRCPETCPEVFAPVCGSDGVTYSNPCQLQLAACTQERWIVTRKAEACNTRDPCEGKQCLYGAECKPTLDGRAAECVCPARCAGPPQRPVCGSDGRDYASECELRRQACRDMRSIEVRFQGRCDPCEGVECPGHQTCQLDENRNALCRCNAACSAEIRPVCASDGKTYTNECNMRVTACRSWRELRVLHPGECDHGSNPCNALACRPEQQCDIDRFGIARCECGPPCPAVMRPVCGADGITYDSPCEASRKACLAGRSAPTIAHPGPCGLRGPCHAYRCAHREARCVVRAGKPSCECPSCPEEFEPVCGTDGISYTNECKLRREACEHNRDISVSHTGLCGGCDKKRCEFHGVCEEDGQCVCPRSCVKVDAPVCGTDGVTYPSECEMRVSVCHKGELVMVASRGQCDQCQHVRCKHGARCDKGLCVCPTSCPEDKREPLCANDGVTYPNECEMRRAACQASRELRVLFYGECDDVGAAQAEAGSGQADCEADDTCRQFGGRCTAEGCDCDLGCPAQEDPVCGSSGRLYANDCLLREDMCRLQVHIHVVSMDRCMPGEQPVPCDGEPPLRDLETGLERTCEDCPSGHGYCHRTSSFAVCCRLVTTIKNCGETEHGCCPDGRTAAQGPDHAGCPDVCECNRLGSYEATCDPVTSQCPCKPGAGGLRCERCEAGFWGLHKITEGNSGCARCACNSHGSVRDDCEQMTGRCVCKHGIGGMKCDVCPPDTVLGPEGCLDASLARAVQGTCDKIKCKHGAMCKQLEDGLARCVCEFPCPPTAAETARPVCGSDGNKYGSECQLRLFSCRYQKLITVLVPCPRDEDDDIEVRSLKGFPPYYN